MEIFHIDEQISLNSADDITLRPNYEYPISPKKRNFVSILAVYAMDNSKVQCGVSDCLQEHSQGYLVNIKDGRETCLCEACGTRFFDIRFDKQQKICLEQDHVRKQKVQINAVLGDVEALKERTKQLKQQPKGANWLYQSLTHFKKAYPEDLIAALKELATDTSNNSVLTTLTENGAKSSEVDSVKQLQGLSIFVTDIRDELIGKILKPLSELEKSKSDIDTVSILNRYCNWAENLEKQFDEVQNLVEEGRVFFTIENINRLRSLPLSNASNRIVRSLHWEQL